MNVSRRSVGGGYGNESNVYSDGDGSDSNEDLRWVLYLTLIFLAIEVIIIYGKYDFLNVSFFPILVDCLDLSPFYLPSQPFRPGLYSPYVGFVEH
jgi:hypothetical protein